MFIMHCVPTKDLKGTSLLRTCYGTQLGGFDRNHQVHPTQKHPWRSSKRFKKYGWKDCMGEEFSAYLEHHMVPRAPLDMVPKENKDG